MSVVLDSTVDALDRAAALMSLDAQRWRVEDTHHGAESTGLADALYERWFTEAAEPVARATTDPPLHHRTLLGPLRAAHEGAARLTPGWVVTKVNPSGGVAVMRSGQPRWAASGDYLLRTHPGVPAAPGEPAELTARRDELDADRGLWWTLSDPEPQAAIGRVYFNARAATVPRVVHEITCALDGFAFKMKCPIYPEAYRRVDAVVLYHDRDTREPLLAALTEKWTTLGPLLDPAVPPLTCLVHPGLAVADELGGDLSYGESRCHMLAEAAMAERHEWNAMDTGSRREVLIAGMRSAGMSLAEPWRQTP